MKKITRLYRLFTLCLLLFGVSLLFWNCENENDIVEQKTEVLLKPTVKTLSYGNTGDIFNKLKNELQLHPYLQLEQEENTLARTTTDTLGITIYTDIIKEVTLGDYTSYTMRIVTPNSNDSRFYNLTIEDRNGESDMFVTKYVPNENWLNDTSKKFEGTMTAMRVENFTTAGDDTDDETNGGDGGGSGGGGNNTTYPASCTGMVISTTSLVGVPCGCGHWPGQTCNGSTCGSPTYPSYENVTTYECIGATEPIDTGNTDGINNNQNIGGGGTSGNTENNPDPDTTSITVLLPPGEECENPPPGDLNGDCQIDNYEACLMTGNSQEICDCVAEGIDLLTCQEDIKCERLNRLVQTDGLGSNILPVVNQLRTKLSADNNEWSISYKNVWLQEGRKNVPDGNGIQEGPSDERSAFNFGNTWVGFIHTHPEGKFTVPSWLDIRALMLLHTDSHNNFNDEIFVMAVAPNNITYALRVDNIQTLISKIDADMQNAEGSTDREKRDNIMDKMAEDYTKSTNLEQTFLSLFGNYGISLYEATDANLSNWKQLTLDENDNETINETPCN